jgi:hypothetical protein
MPTLKHLFFGCASALKHPLFGCRMPDARRQPLSICFSDAASALWMPDAGCRMPDTGCQPCLRLPIIQLELNITISLRPRLLFAGLPVRVCSSRICVTCSRSAELILTSGSLCYMPEKRSSKRVGTSSTSATTTSDLSIERRSPPFRLSRISLTKRYLFL